MDGLIVAYLIGGFVWLCLCSIPAGMARDKGYSAIGFFLLSIVISPLLAFIIILIMPARAEVKQNEQLQTKTHRKCPYCAEVIKAEAIVCKHCGHDITAQVADERQRTGKAQEAAEIKAREERLQADHERVVELSRRVAHNHLEWDEYQKLASALGGSLALRTGMFSTKYAVTVDGSETVFKRFKDIRPWFAENIVPRIHNRT